MLGRRWRDCLHRNSPERAKGHYRCTGARRSRTSGSLWRMPRRKCLFYQLCHTLILSPALKSTISTLLRERWWTVTNYPFHALPPPSWQYWDNTWAVHQKRNLSQITGIMEIAGPRLSTGQSLAERMRWLVRRLIMRIIFITSSRKSCKQKRWTTQTKASDFNVELYRIYLYEDVN